MTAEEYLKSKEPNTFVVPEEYLIEFARHHVEKALKAANELVTMIYEGESIGQEYDDIYIEDITVENTYPLENIK